jgi:hypothetical protein
MTCCCQRQLKTDLSLRGDYPSALKSVPITVGNLAERFWSTAGKGCSILTSNTLRRV